MAIEFDNIGNAIECKTPLDSSALIWLTKKYQGLTFMCGDFTIEELEQILNKMKELRSNANRTIPK